MSSKNKFWISDNDKEWIHDSFSWLIQVYGYPSKNIKTILFTQEFFPATFSIKKIDVNKLITDLCNLLVLDEKKITYELVEDARNIDGMPYEIHGLPFECEMEIMEGQSYHLSIAKALLGHPSRLLLSLILQTVTARQHENKISFGNVGEPELLMYNIGIYFGFGLLLYQNLVDQGKSSDGIFWEKKWHYSSDIPAPVMAYALALFYNLNGDKDPKWKKELKADLLKEYDRAATYINDNGNPLFDKHELMGRSMFDEGDLYSLQNNFSDAISTFQKALFVTKDEYLRMDLYNNIGYNYLRMEEYGKSIPYFQKALEINPGYGYANDNLGFAFIMSGDLETGKFYLSAALRTGDNDAGYSYRNFALYHQKKKDYKQAEENFQKAFNNIDMSIDLLEYFYAQFLFEIDEDKKGMQYLKK
ncbi:MAG TPA: tetratricopeptide repeat protein, partial [Chitinophagaceae bacterium]|nr:tetratricopeptide repeat protein [Chitinophagaceae bacterium]